MTDPHPLTTVARHAETARESTPPPVTFGELIRRFRLAVGLTQEELAERAGISVHSVSDFERGFTNRPQRETIRLLADALQLAPDDRAVFEAAGRGRSAASPRLVPHAPAAPTHNLPTPLTPLVGRDGDVAALCGLLRRPEVRLVTVVGPGGIGKTRLTLDAARDMLDAFPDGVLFVSLAAVRDADRVLATIAQTLGVKASAGQSVRESLFARLADMRLLLVLDNFEHLLDAAVSVTELLAACAGVKALVTSRAILHVRGEYAWPVGPLALPTPGDAATPSTLAGVAAVALFVQRAEAARPDFRLTETNGTAIAALCVRLDGIPLALELAAAQLRATTPAHLLARFARRLPLLTGGARDLPARQRTMRDTIAWSYDLLPANAQHLFRTRAVFVGGWTLDAAEAVASALDGPSGDAAEPALLSLMDNSLVRQEMRGEMVRYTMLETIREYAAECAIAGNEYDAARRAHAAYFLAFAARAAPRLSGPEQARWLDLLEADHDNMRAALNYLQDADRGNDGLRLATALARFWLVRSHFGEGEAWLERFLALTAGESDPAMIATRAEAFGRVGMLAIRRGEYARGIEYCEEGLAIWRALGDTGGIALMLRSLGVAAWFQGEHDHAAAYFTDSLALYRERDEPSGIAAACNNLGLIADRRGNYDEAVERYTISLALWRKLGDKQGSANALHNLGLVAQKRLDTVHADACYTESLALRRDIGDRLGIAQSLNGLGIVASLQDEYERAETLFAESLALDHEIGNRAGAGHTLYHWANMLRACGAYDRAEEYYEESLAIRREIGSQVEIADSLSGLATIARLTDAYDRASPLHEAALPLYRATGNALGAVQCIEGWAFVAAHLGQSERAVLLFGSTHARRDALGTPLQPKERTLVDDAIAAARAAIGEQKFMTAWAQGLTMSLEQACDVASTEHMYHHAPSTNH